MTSAQSKLEFMASNYAAAWSSGSAEAVGNHFAPDGQLTINRGDVASGRQAIIEIAAGFMSEFPDLKLTCDLARFANQEEQSHALFAWTLVGHHAHTNNRVKIAGWEEWELDEYLKVKCSLGWFDAVDYQRQIDGK